MRTYIMVVLLGCLILSSVHPSESNGIRIWTEKGCDATYSPGEMVKIHYSFDRPGWSRLFKLYPDSHEEEISGWRYFSTGGEYTELHTLGPECGKITFTIRFYEDMGFCPLCIPCHVCGPPVIYVSQTGYSMCSITVVCDLSSALYTDKKEYLAGIDSQAHISLHITDIQGFPQDVDAVVMDVNGDEIAAVKESPGVYTATYYLANRKQGVYVVTASIFKRDHPHERETSAFKIVIPVTISLSTEREAYTREDQVTIRAEVKNPSLKGVSGLHFDVSVGDALIPFIDKGGGIYEAQVPLTAHEIGEYHADIVNMEQYIRVDRVYRATFQVTGRPELLLMVPDLIEVPSGSQANISLHLSNNGQGDATRINLMLESPPGVDIQALSGYAFTLPPGGQSDGVIFMKGMEEGQYSLTIHATYEDVGGTHYTASSPFTVQVTSQFPVLFIVGLAMCGVIGVGVIIIVLRNRTQSTHHNSS